MGVSMTKKELEKRIKELEQQLLEVASINTGLSREIARLETKFQEAHQVIRNVVTIAWAAMKEDPGMELDEAMDVIKMLSDNAWIQLENW